MTTALPTKHTIAKSTTGPALTVENLSAGYPGHTRAVENVSFDVMSGERVAIIGPNGAGKSTLFKAIVGLIPHNTGEISIHGEDCHTSHSMVGYVPQQEEIDWTFPVTVYDVVMMGRTRKIGWLHIAGKRDREAVMNALEQVGMARFAKRQIGELSGGQKRRVFIARALTQETDVLLLDEPFSGVDLSAESEIMETLDRLQSAKFTLLLATHDLHKASTEFDRLLLLNQRVIAFGDPKTAFTPENLRLAYGGRIGVFSQNGKTMIIADEHGHD